MTTLTITTPNPSSAESAWISHHDHLSRDRQAFLQLAKKWRDETSGYPRLKDRFSHSTYKNVISWGENAIPHLLDAIDGENPDFWFEALSQITGADPVPQAGRGNIEKMVDAWLSWGRQKGLTR